MGEVGAGESLDVIGRDGCAGRHGVWARRAKIHRVWMAKPRGVAAARLRLANARCLFAGSCRRRAGIRTGLSGALVEVVRLGWS